MSEKLNLSPEARAEARHLSEVVANELAGLLTGRMRVLRIARATRRIAAAARPLVERIEVLESQNSRAYPTLADLFRKGPTP